jgi:ATP-dependent helicase YprA (DUF1998 family)
LIGFHRFLFDIRLSTNAMNPLLIARNLRTEYLKLLKTAFSPRQEDLKRAFHAEIEKDGFLTRESFIALAQPFASAPPLNVLSAEARARFGSIAEEPYRHQSDACRRILEGKPTVVATGTGSGKTEAFLMPIVDHCLRTLKQGEASVKAILIYPMNALANDQCGRIRKLLEGTSISFGRYTGDTKIMGLRPADAPENERVLRSEFRTRPPNLLLTNYLMLEYMLIRTDGREIFKNHRVRHIVLDEVHTYHGTLGTDVACLLRRLGDVLRKSNPGVEPVYIGTSATLQAGDEGDPKVGVAQFFARLTGLETPPESIVTEITETPPLPAELRLPPPPEISEEELSAFDQDDPQRIAALVRKLAGAPRGSAESPAALWSRAALPHLMMEWLRHPRSEQEVLELLAARPERRGTGTESLRRELEAALLVGPCVPEGGLVKVRPRVHRFLRGLARFWRCTNPACGRLLGEGIGECDGCGSKSLPLALCRTCGWDFFVAVFLDDDRALEPWTARRSTKDTLFLYDPPEARVAVDPEVDASGAEDVAEEPAVALGDELDPDSEPEFELTELSRFDHKLDPSNLRLLRAGEESPPGKSDLLRPVRVHKGRGTRCPICSSRYGSFDVLTPVSLGNSSALTHVSRVLMNGLPPEERKLLVFCDSRQDASHQARFIEASEDRVRLRRLVYSLLDGERDPHDLQWLVEGLHERYVIQGRFAKTKKKDQLSREKDKVLGELLSEFVISPRVRAALERMGLVRVRYAGLDEAFASNAFQRLAAEHQLRPGVLAHATQLILDEMRRRMAVNHEVFKSRLYANDKLAARYGIQVNRYIGKPAAFLPPGQKSADTRSYRMNSTWNTKGSPTAIQRLWQHVHQDGDMATRGTAAALEALLAWLADESYLAWEKIGQEHERAEGYQVDQVQLEFEVGRSFRRCSVCDRVTANEPDEHPCDRPDCSGRMLDWPGPIADGNLNALMAAEDYAPPLFAAEHSAAVTEEDREQAEDGFMNRTPPRPNVLACTPTLEMGVNIGDLEAVAMRNIPPSPAQYAQRSGRTGRVSRMGIVAGFSRNTPHDGYFFDHPGEIISGAIPPPRFNLDNLEAISRHARSLVLEHAGIDIPSNLANYLTDKGKLIEHAINDLLAKIQAASGSAVESANRLWPDLPAAPKDFLESIAAAFPDQVKATLIERGKLLAQAAEEVRKLGEKIKLTVKEEQAQSGYRLLAIRLREDNRYAYLPRVLAEAGLLPGYSFPSDPGSVALGYQPEPIFGGRLQAQREFAPGQIVYARGGRWRVTGVALHRPGSPAGPDQSMFKFTLCGSCGLANRPNLNFCARCRAPIGDADGAGLATYTAWDASAFQAWESEVVADSEEDRMTAAFDIRPHPQLDRDGTRYRVGPWALDLRSQEEIWFINHGRKELGSLADDRASSPGFVLCPLCGDAFDKTEQKKLAKGAKEPEGEAALDPRAALGSHAKRCNGTPDRFSLGHKQRADTLRLVVPDPAQLGGEAVAWSWSLLYALVQGAIRRFEVDEDDIEAYVLTRTLPTADGPAQEEPLDLLLIDPVLGGSGLLKRLAEDLPAVARAALEHLDGHECPNSCYRCLRSYRNQRLHRLLDWRMAVPYLRALSGEVVVGEGQIHGVQPVPGNEGPEWDEARAEGCESPQELNLLKAIRGDGSLPEPQKQYEVWDGGSMLTRADFAFLGGAKKVLIYVDGLQWHSSIRQRVLDNRITNRLQMMDYLVLRFLGSEVQHTPQMCVRQIKLGLGIAVD